MRPSPVALHPTSRSHWMHSLDLCQRESNETGHCRSHNKRPSYWCQQEQLRFCTFFYVQESHQSRGYDPFSSVQFSHSVVFDSLWPHGLQQASQAIANSQSLLKLMSIESVMPSNHLILCRPHLLPTSIFPSIRGFSSESVLHIKWPKDWSFSFSISPSNEYSRLTSFRMDWLDLLAVQGTLKRLFQHHSSKVSILRRSAFFIV